MSFLLQPLQAGSLALSNRLIMPPMATAKTEDGLVNQSLLDYYNEKSAGGYFSMIITEHSFIAPDGKAHAAQLSVADDSVSDGLRKLSATIRNNGSKAIMQINHAGSGTTEEVIGKRPAAPSAIPNPRLGTTPRELTRQEIAGIVRSFQDAALRVKNTGFDGVEIHSAHGYLLSQFFSPLTNQRTDEYGGSLQNRVRIHLEIIQAVRAAVGPKFPVLLRLGASDYKDGGITIEDSQWAAKEFEKAGIDVIDISGSFSGYTPPPNAPKQGYFAPLTQAIKQSVSIPVILTGGITDAQAAEQLLSEGKTDLIGVGRAALIDSLWAKHAVESLSNV